MPTTETLLIAAGGCELVILGVSIYARVVRRLKSEWSMRVLTVVLYAGIILLILALATATGAI